MDAGDSPLPDNINPHNFPAKLWRLVNSPEKSAICWDSQGEGILIDKELFEKQILKSPSTFPFQNPNAFKTTNFSSFVRQLNLYGFKKTEPINEEKKSGKYQHFINPIFKRKNPELVARLLRLTAENKARIEAGENVNWRPSSKYTRVSSGNVKKGKSLLQTPTQQQLTHPYYLNQVQPGIAHNGTPVPPRHLMRGQDAALFTSVFSPDKGIPPYFSGHYAGEATGSNAHPYYLKQVQPGIAHNGTPVPPRHLMRGQDAALSTSVFAPDKGIPAYFSGHYAGEATGSNAVHFQPGLLAHANHRNVQYQYFLGMTNMIQQDGLHAGPFSPYTYYQGSCPANMFCAGDNNLNLQNMQTNTMKNNEVNLEKVFQIADEVMQTTPNSLLVKVKSPEKPSSVSVPPPSAIITSSSKEPTSNGNIIKAVSSMANPAKKKPQEEFGISIPEQLPEDAISEVTSDDAEDSCYLVVEESDTAQGTDEDESISCSGSTV